MHGNAIRLFGRPGASESVSLREVRAAVLAAPAQCAQSGAQKPEQPQVSYRNLLDLSFPELGNLLEIDGVGIRQLLAQAPTPSAMARMRRSTLEKNWMLRPKAAQLKKLAAESMVDPELAAASSPALSPAMLQALTRSKRACVNSTARLKHSLPRVSMRTPRPWSNPSPVSARLTRPVLAFLPSEILHAGRNRQAAARLQAFMGNDPRLRQSGQWQGQTKMSKRGVDYAPLFEAAFSASQHDPELRSFYQRKRAQGKHDVSALSDLMRILTRRLVAVLRSGKAYQPNYQPTLANVA